MQGTMHALQLHTPLINTRGVRLQSPRPVVLGWGLIRAVPANRPVDGATSCLSAVAAKMRLHCRDDDGIGSVLHPVLPVSTNGFVIDNERRKARPRLPLQGKCQYRFWRLNLA